MILLLLGCTAPLGALAGPSMVDAVASLLTRLDRDHHGRGVAAEYAVVAPAGPAFAEVDSDGDGALGADELAALVVRSGAETAGTTEVVPAPGKAAPGKAPARTPDGVRDTTDTLKFLAAEVAAKDPTLPLPTEDEIARAGRTGTLDSDASQQVLRSFAAAWARVGLPFPALLAAEPSVTGTDNSP